MSRYPYQSYVNDPLGYFTWQNYYYPCSISGFGIPPEDLRAYMEVRRRHLAQFTDQDSPHYVNAPPPPTLLDRLNENGYRAVIDVALFRPGEITVTVKNRCIVAEGRHEERAEGDCYMTRHFIRRYELSDDCQETDVSTQITQEGMLIIEAPGIRVPPQEEAEQEGGEPLLSNPRPGPSSYRSAADPNANVGRMNR